VLWPFIAGWFAVALAVGVYRSRTQPWARLAATGALGIAVALVLRAAVTHRGTPVVFIAVAYAFIVLTTIGWRAIAVGVSRLTRR
jgi:hypothetical protein